MRNAAGQLSHRLHFLGLQQRRLGLLSRLDFGTEPFVSGGELTSSLCHGALELFAVARQRCSRIAQLVADLFELTHTADQRTDGLASSQSLRGGRQRLDRPPDPASHPPAQEQARRKDRCTPAKGQQSRTADRSVDKLPRQADRCGPAGYWRAAEGRIYGDAFAGNVGKPVLDGSTHRRQKRRRNRLAEKPLQFAIARDNDPLTVEEPSGPIRRKIWLLDQRGQDLRPEPHRQHIATWPSRKTGTPTTRIGRRKTAPRIRSEIWG